MKKYLISDTHFSHANIVRYCSRPYWKKMDGFGDQEFPDIDNMNLAMYQNWNEIITPEDEVFHIGDVGCWFKDPSWIETFLPKLNGKKFLIPGNHDKKLLDKLRRYFTVLPPIHNIHVEHEDAGHVMMVLCHYPIWSWEGKFHGAIHCYGHTHAHVPELGNSAVHIGVDTNGFKPISTDDVITLVTQRVVSSGKA